MLWDMELVFQYVKFFSELMLTRNKMASFFIFVN